MFTDTGSPLWVLIDVVAVLAFGAALVYGMGVWKRRRDRALERVRDNATDRLYKAPDAEKPRK